MILVSLCSVVHVIRIHAIYDKSRAILGGLGAVLLFQVRSSAPRIAIVLPVTCPMLLSHPAPIPILRSTQAVPSALSLPLSPPDFPPRRLFAFPILDHFAC